MAKKVIRLTESDIRNMVMESVDSLIKEYMENGMEASNPNLEYHLPRMIEALSKTTDKAYILIKGYANHGQGEGEIELVMDNGDVYTLTISMKADMTYEGSRGDGYLTPPEGPEYDFDYNDDIKVHFWDDAKNDEEFFNIPISNEGMINKFLNVLAEHIDVECDEFEPYQKEWERPDEW